MAYNIVNVKHASAWMCDRIAITRRARRHHVRTLVSAVCVCSVHTCVTDAAAAGFNNKSSQNHLHITLTLDSYYKSRVLNGGCARCANICKHATTTTTTTSTNVLCSVLRVCDASMRGMCAGVIVPCCRLALNCKFPVVLACVRCARCGAHAQAPHVCAYTFEPAEHALEH